MTTSKKRAGRSKKSGLPPGTLVHVGPESDHPVSVKTFSYSPDSFTESTSMSLAECCPVMTPGGVTWVEVDGIHKPELIEHLGGFMKLHPLVMEDIVNSTQRPKVEEYDEYLFIVLKMIQFDEKAKRISVEQVSLVVGDGYVLLFQENRRDVFDRVRDRIRNPKSRLRKLGADYLAYAIIDAIVDNYFVILEAMGEELEDLEKELISEPNPATLNRIYGFKRAMMALRRAGWPLREVTMSLERSDSGIIQHSTKVYLRDVYDHATEIIDIIESIREMSSGMIDVYLSSMSNKLNEVMKVLTVIATIFMPLTFISSIYGMNFHDMPELSWHYGYPAALLLMGGIALAMIIYFRGKKWV